MDKEEMVLKLGYYQDSLIDQVREQGYDFENYFDAGRYESLGKALWELRHARLVTDKECERIIGKMRKKILKRLKKSPFQLLPIPLDDPSFQLIEGMKLRHRKEFRDWNDEVSEVVRYREGKGWEILDNGNFSDWYPTLADVDREYLLIGDEE